MRLNSESYLSEREKIYIENHRAMNTILLQKLFKKHIPFKQKLPV